MDQYAYNRADQGLEDDFYAIMRLTGNALHRAGTKTLLGLPWIMGRMNNN